MQDTNLMSDELDYDLLVDEDLADYKPWPKNTAFIELNGKRYRVHAEPVEADDEYEALQTMEELYWWIINREKFTPRNAAEDWLDTLLVQVGETGVQRSEALSEAAAAGFGDKAISRAFTRIGAHSHRQGVRQPARWYRNQSLCHKLH